MIYLKVIKSRSNMKQQNSKITKLCPKVLKAMIINWTDLYINEKLLKPEKRCLYYSILRIDKNETFHDNFTSYKNSCTANKKTFWAGSRRSRQKKTFRKSSTIYKMFIKRWIFDDLVAFAIKLFIHG